MKFLRACMYTFKHNGIPVQNDIIRGSGRKWHYTGFRYKMVLYGVPIRNDIIRDSDFQKIILILKSTYTILGGRSCALMASAVHALHATLFETWPVAIASVFLASDITSLAWKIVIEIQISSAKK